MNDSREDPSMPRLPLLLAGALIILPACGTAAEPDSDAASTSAPSETRAPETKLKPAVPGQTRAPTLRAPVDFAVEEVASGLDQPWALEFLPDGRILVSQRSGTFRLVNHDGTLSE